MPSFVMTDAFININGVDLSDQVSSVTVTMMRDLKDVTTMTKTGRIRKPGLGDWSMRFDFFQNFDTGKVSATLDPLLGVQTPLRVRATNGAISTTNPEYQGNGIYGEWTPLNGTIGEPSTTSITFLCADGIALVKDTVP